VWTQWLLQQRVVRYIALGFVSQKLECAAGNEEGGNISGSCDVHQHRAQAIRQPAIRHEEIVVATVHQSAARRDGPGGIYFVGRIGKEVGEQLEKFGVIFDQQDARRRRRPRRSAPRLSPPPRRLLRARPPRWL
jgi:hypothetical protein